MNFSIGWILWVAAALTSFAVLETLALLSQNPDATLSSHLRKWLGISPRQPWRMAGIALVLGGCSWLAAHLILG